MSAAIRILLVEDSPTDVLLTEEALAAGRFHVQRSQRLGDALKLLLANQFDVILLDLGLPDSQGLATLRTLRERDRQVAIVVLTGKDDEELALRALKEGAQDYLVKGDVQAGSLQRSIRYAVERSSSDRMLRESEARVWELTAHIDQVLWTIDAREAKILYVSAGYEKMWGRSCQSLLDNPHAYMEGVHPLDQEMMVRENAAMYQTGHIDVECRVLRPDGSVRWVWIRGYPVAERGRCVRLVGVIEDVTEKRRLAVEREALLTRLQLHIERMPLAYILFDADARIVDWNPAAERIFGYARQEMLGMGPPYAKYVPRSFYQEKGERLLGRMRAGDMDAHSIHENLTKDGRTVTCQWFNTPILDGQGQFVGLICLAQDITARKWLEDEIWQAKLRLEHVLASSPAVLFTLGVEGERFRLNWISKNVAAMGYRVEDALEPNWWQEHVHPDDLKQVRADIQKSLAPTGSVIQEYRFRHGNGAYHWIRSEMRLLRDDAGKPEIVGSWSDITERKGLEDQFRQSQKMDAIGRLAGGVAHDFNNLLTVINGYSQLVMSRLAADDPAREMLRQVVAAGDRAADLTRQLLTFSRKAIIEPKILNLKAVVADVDKMLRRVIGEDIQLTVVSDPEVGAVKADAGQVEQVIMNLVVNARDAMPKGGQLTIEARNAVLDETYVHDHQDARTGRHVLLAVTDTGCGIDRLCMSRIFEPFYTTKGEGGTGLGLATVHGIVKQNGGHVAVYSEVGRGTTFKVYLPQVEQRPAAAAPPKGPAELPHGSETVLFVEDEDGVRALSRHVLQNVGYKVLEARDGVDALRVAGEHQGRIDLLVTDVVMPRMGGREVAERFAATYSGAKVLFLSGYTDDAVVRHGILQAQVPFLQKPFRPESLVMKVREVLDRA